MKATVVNSSGYYAGLGKNARNRHWSKLVSPIKEIQNRSCLSFLYIGSNNNITVQSYNGSAQRELFKIAYDGMQKNWHRADYDLEPGTYGFGFLLEFTNLSRHEVGIDDIKIQDGICENQGK